MESEKGDSDKVTTEEMLQHCKIVTVFDGYLDFVPDNLKRILSRVEVDTKFGGNLPVAILAVIGPPKSGKTLLTNFLIECLKSERRGGWIDRCKEFQQGFSWGNVKSDKFYQPKGDTGISGGIYLWPEPFLMKKPEESTKGSDTIVWIMHMHCVKEEEITVLERFLSMICSRVIEIQWKNKELRLLDHQLFFNSKCPREPPQLNACDSAYYLARTNSKVTTVFDDEASKHLLKIISDKCDTSAYQEKIGEVKNLCLSGIKDLEYVLENENGTLKLEGFKAVRSVLNTVMGQILSEYELTAKKFNKVDLVLSSMRDAIQLATTYAVDIHAKTGTGATCKIDQEPEKRPQLISANTHTEEIAQFTLSVNNRSYVSTVSVAVSGENYGKSSSCSHREWLARARADFFSSEMEPYSSSSMSVHQSYNSLADDLKDYVVVNEEGEEICENEEQTISVNLPVDKTLDNCNNAEEFEDMDTSENTTAIQPDDTSQFENVNTGCPTPQALERSLVPKEKLEYMETDLDAAEEAWNAIESSLGNKPHQLYEENRAIHQDRHSPGCQDGYNFSVDKTEVTTEMRPVTLEAPETGNQPEAHNRQKDEERKQQRRESKRIAEMEEKRKKEEEQKKREEEMKRKKEEEEMKRKEEIKRKKEEEEKIIEANVKKASNHINQTLVPATYNFIDVHLNLNTIHNFGTIYAHVLNSIVETPEFCLSINSRQKVRVQTNGICKKRAMEFLETISSNVLEFNRSIRKKFDMLGYFVSGKLNDILQEEHQKIIEKKFDNEEILRLIARACTRLGQIYYHHNRIIKDHERDLHQIMKPQMLNVYHEQMKRYMENAPFNPNKLSSIHQQLSAKLVDALRNACRLQPNVDGEVSPTLASLKDELAEAFKPHQSSNEFKLKKLQMEVAKIADKFKSEYHRKCEDIFTKYPDGVDAKTLGKLHEAICAETKKLLEMEIRNKIRKDEPVKSYTCALQEHIDSYWKTVLEVNRKNLNLKQERDKQAERDRVKEEARLQLQEKENKLRSGSEASTTKKDPAIRITRPIQKQQTNRQVLPPLVFHFRSTNIVMGMKGCNEPIPNESKEPRTPAFVVVTPENEIIYGSAALALVEADSVPENLQGGCFWTITDLFLTPDKNLNKDVYIDSQTHTITHEFLLGFIFRKLKDSAEQQITGVCSQTLIVVPFWLSSTQRLRVKHAAMLAGFSEAYLINEAAAAAYNFALDTISRPRPGRALVLAENLDRVDAFVYEYQPYEKKVKVVFHSSNYHNTKVNKGLMKQLTGGLNKLRQVAADFWNDEKHSEEDKIKADIREACRKVTSHDSNLKDEINEVLWICGNDRKWADLMKDVAKGFGRKAVGINEETAVMTAAISLCNDVSHVGISVSEKLIANVDRRGNWGAAAIVISRNDCLPQEVKLVGATLPSASGDMYVDLYQEICDGIHAIGSLKITDLMYFEKLEVRVQITNDGVVTFKDVMTGGNSKFDTRSYLSPDRYTWEPEMLKQMELEKHLELLELVIGPKEDPELIQAKETLFGKCTELEEKLNQGKLKARSDVVKEYIRKAIFEAREFGNHANAKLEHINSQLANLKKLFDKYDKTTW